jgi:iron complex transport system ATP-binding protein
MALARQLAYVPQNHSNSLGFSVADMVLMGRSLYWRLFRGPTHTDYKEVDQALEQLGIIDLKEYDFNLLSGGQQQLVLIARALCQGANTLVLDEPTAHLDFANAAKVIRTLARLAEQGKSVLFSTHNPQDALNIGTHACLIKDHTVLAQGTVCEVITSSNLSQVYGLPMVVSQCKCVLLGNCESSGNSACISSPSGLGYSGEPQSSQ